jgi:hypothetical protein
MSRIRPSARACLAALALGLPLTAQPQYPDYPELISLGDAVPWPATLGAGSFGRAEPVRFTPAAERGLVMSWGATIVYAYAPMTHQVIVDSGITASAFTVIYAPDGATPDVLVAAAVGGLVSYTYDLAGGQFIGTGVSGTSALAGATQLATGDLDGDGDLDIAGVESDGATLRVLYGDGTGTFGNGVAVALPGTARDLAVLQWKTSGEPGLEIAVSSTWGTEVYNDLGQRLWNRFSAHPTPTLAVLRAAGEQVEDRLAVVQRNTADTADLLTVFAADAIEAASNLGDIDVVGLDAEDYDGDGDDDLAVAQRATHELWIFENRTHPGGFAKTFPSAPEWTVRVGEVAGAPYAANTADPVLTDMNSDGQIDVLVGVHDQTLTSHEKWLFAKAAGSRVQGGFPDSTVAPFQNYSAHVGSDLVEPYGSALIVEGNLAVELELVNVWGDLSQGAEDMHMEVTVWRQLVGVHETVEDDALYHAVYAIDYLDSAQLAFLGGYNDPESPLRIGFSVDVPHADPELDPQVPVPFVNKFYVEARPVRYQNGTISSPLRIVIASITGIDEPTQNGGGAGSQSIADMENNPGALAPTYDLMAEYSAWEIPPDSGGYVGGLVVQQRVPTTLGLPGVPHVVNSWGQ